MPKRVKKVARKDDLFFKVVPVVIFVLAALFYLIVPYEIISGMGLSFRATHEDHMLFGLVFLVMAALFWFIQGRKKNGK